MDIRLSEYEKRIAKLGIILIKKKIGNSAKKENIDKYFQKTKCEALKNVIDMIDFVYGNTKSKHQANIINDYVKFGLWLCCNHPKLRKALEGILNKYTKYDNVKIDLEYKTTKFEQYLLERAIIFTMKKISARPTYFSIISELPSVTNKLAKHVMKDIDSALSKMNDDFLQKSMKSFIWLGLWIGVNDTAYRAQLYYVVNHLGNKELYDISKDYYFEPEDWYINIHYNGRMKTQEKHDKNEIPRHENDLLENPCMVKKQKEKIDRIIKKIGGAF